MRGILAAMIALLQGAPRVSGAVGKRWRHCRVDVKISSLINVSWAVEDGVPAMAD